jgi:hypothetical protein
LRVPKRPVRSLLRLTYRVTIEGLRVWLDLSDPRQAQEIKPRPAKEHRRPQDRL